MKFTPYVETLSAEVTQELAAFLSLEPERQGGLKISSLVSRDESQPRRWIATAMVKDTDGDFIVELFGAATQREAWFRTPHFAFSMGKVEQKDPYSNPASAAWLNSFRQRMENATPSARLLELLSHYEPFLSLREESFRIVMGHGERRNGALWLGHRCNQNCNICWQGRDWPEPPKEQFFRWLDELIAAGTRSVVISGGEPTLQPYLSELVAKAARGGLYVVVETNGTLLADAELRLALRRAGLSELLVSLHSADPAVSDAITRTPGSHAQTVQGIEAAIADGINVGLQCVVDRQNHLGLESLARFIVERFRQPSQAGLLRRVAFSMPTRYFDPQLYRQMMPPIDEVRPGLARATEILKSARIEVSVLGMSGFPICVIPDPKAVADELPRNEVSHGERNGRTYAPVCESCDVRPRCYGVHQTYLEVHSGRGLEPVQLRGSAPKAEVRR